ncbi:hypothetical protein KUV44_12525 [Marinobacter daepoensis]|uniref:Glycosyl-4,4'-diaponeurosporenoate acyltransferase n=1 Tax=Marinobacter daepoensis TaxID=262077 RepID=A0ABS3BIR4_9GAMM|nr:hypothetical protein [Marinobacter daepoensis]MBN7771367.1 hypothetical protein [Marinobacter daepoensis]MBY6079968.1 hypothetical protein [Marinobacter daepoensis]
MDQILVNMKDPSWWFTGVFFVLVGIFLTKLASDWLPRAWVYLGRVIPHVTRKIQRWRERKILLRVKRFRQYEIKVHWLISRYWALATIFIMYTGFIMISFAVSNSAERELTEIKRFFPLVLPIYGLQFIVMWEKSVLKRVMTAHIKWKQGVTSAANGRS